MTINYNFCDIKADFFHVKNWRKIASKYGISNAEKELKSRAFQQ